LIAHWHLQNRGNSYVSAAFLPYAITRNGRTSPFYNPDFVPPDEGLSRIKLLHPIPPGPLGPMVWGFRVPIGDRHILLVCPFLKGKTTWVVSSA